MNRSGNCPPLPAHFVVRSCKEAQFVTASQHHVIFQYRHNYQLLDLQQAGHSNWEGYIVHDLADSLHDDIMLEYLRQSALLP